MRTDDVRRIVLLTDAGVRAPEDRPKFADRVIRGLVRVAQPAVLADGAAAVALLVATDLDWTVVRGPRLVDAPARGGVRTSAYVGGDTGTTLGRDDLAAFLVDEAVTPRWLRQRPVVSW